MHPPQSVSTALVYGAPTPQSVCRLKICGVTGRGSCVLISRRNSRLASSSTAMSRVSNGMRFTSSVCSTRCCCCFTSTAPQQLPHCIVRRCYRRYTNRKPEQQFFATLLGLFAFSILLMASNFKMQVIPCMSCTPIGRWRIN